MRNDRARWLLVLSLFTIFFVAAAVSAPSGQNMGPLSAPAGFLAAWFFGLYPGLLLAILSFVWTTGTLLFYGHTDIVTTPPFMVGGTLSFLITFGIGWTRSLNIAHQHELKKRAEIERELRKARADAERASQEKSRFLANMSHELRTPLASILGYAELLLEDAEEDGQDAYIEDLTSIMHAGQELVSLVNQVLELSRIESGRLDLCPAPTDVTHILKELTDPLEPLAHQRHNTLAIHPINLTLHHDEARLRQVVLNLLTDTCKNARDAEITVTCAPQTLEDTPWVRFDITDASAGRTTQQLGDLLDTFDPALPHDPKKGAGLELNLAIRLASMMGGSLTARDAAGAGSTLSLLLPQHAPVTSGNH